MLGANRTITIFNRYIDADRKERWAGTVIKDVSWQYSHAAQTGKEGMQTSETCTIRIPVGADTQGKDFVSRRSFLQNQDGAWTASPRDKVVLGEVEGAPDDDTLPTWLEKNCDAVITINAVSDNRGNFQGTFLGKLLPHIRIGGF